MDCAACGTTLLADARFCVVCGATAKPTAGKAAAPTAPAPSPPAAAQVPRALTAPAAGPAGPALAGGAETDRLHLVDGYLMWNLHPGQVARLITPALADSIDGARGVAVNDGTRALVFINGALAADLQQGLFDVARTPPTEPAATAPAEHAAVRRGGLLAFVASGTAHAARMLRGPGRPAPEAPAAAPTAGDAAQLVSVLLVRQGPMPLVLTLTLPTASVAATVAVQLFVEITDPAAFSRALMQVRRELGLDALALALTPIVEPALRAVLRTVPAEGSSEPGLELRVAAAMGEALRLDWGFLRIVRVATVTMRREEIERLARFREATYLSEQALAQVSARNEFANRLHLERNRQRIDQAAGAQRLQAALTDINRDDLVGRDDLARFTLLLDHGRRLREAATEGEYQDALAGLRRSELLREDSVAYAAREAQERREDHAHRRLHALELFDLSRQMETDQARLQWEYGVGDQRIALALQRRLGEHAARFKLTALDLEEERLRDDHLAERERAADERRRSVAGHAHGERLAQLEIARQAQALGEDRRREEHVRTLAAEAQRARDAREAILVEAQRWAGMTVEQIIAANGALTPAAAAALATKYQAEAQASGERSKAEAAENAGDQRARAAESGKDELKRFMTDQLAAMQELMRQTLDSNARIAGAAPLDGRRAGGPAAVPAGAAFCSRCGRGLGGNGCPVCDALPAGGPPR
jgi:hypothetical protein